MKKTKLLAVTDDIRMPSGVGIQANKFLRGLNKTGRYEVTVIAGSVIPQPPDPVMYEGIKLYPTADGYGNPPLLRAVMTMERPDIVLAFSDPRFFTYLFMMDNEIRNKSKLIYYHTWDNAPFPKYNLPWYSACDEVVMISEFSYKLMSENGVSCHCIPHGMDPSEFYPLPDSIVKKERDIFLHQVGFPDTKFIIFWNNRNITRKRPGDVLHVFKKFNEKYPDSLLLLNTAAIDRDGTDLAGIVRDLYRNRFPVVFNLQRLPSDKLNIFYNIADITLNIPYNEGWGLCVTESLCAGTPVIATRTGGMIEQMEQQIFHEARQYENEKQHGDYTEIKQFGALIEPVVQELYGVPGMPYIFRDYVSYKDVLSSLDSMYLRKQEGTLKELGLQGRDYVIQNFHIDSTIKKWDELLQSVMSKPSIYKKWSLKLIG